jgi:hypothetical protein
MGKNKHLDLFKDIIPAVDMGIKELWDAAGEGGQKDIKGDLWNLNRYISSVSGSFEKQALAVLKTNEYYNKNWAVLGANHPKLQWYLLCQAGKTGKKEFHPWIKLDRKSDLSNPSVKLVSEIYPNMKIDEVNLLVKLSTKEELRTLAREHGIEDFKL